MSKWKKFEVESAPTNWCFVKTPGSDFQILAKWSRSNYAWIGMDLIQILRYKEVDQYIETDYRTLNDMIYNPRPKK